MAEDYGIALNHVVPNLHKKILVIMNSSHGSASRNFPQLDGVF